MQLLKREFDNFDGANYWVAGLSKAINTTYIPSGNSIEEVYASFLKIQLGRSFNHDCGFSSANLEMVFNESGMTIGYISTSGTQVILQYFFDEKMKFKRGSVGCWLPDDRVGGCHYELITQLIYDYKWSKDGVPLELMSLNTDKAEAEFPTPVWVLDDLANCRAQNNPDERDAQLLEFGYTPVAKPIGFERAWQNSNPEVYYPYIVLSEKYSHNSKNYFILKDGDCMERDYSISYKRLLEILAEPPKSKREDYEDYESEYTDADES